MSTVAKKPKPAKSTPPVPRPPREPDVSTYSGRCAARLRECRQAKKLSVETFVGALNKLLPKGEAYTDKAVYHWETGHAAIPLDALPLCAEVLGMTLKKFLPDA